MKSTQIISHQLSLFCVPDVDSVSPKHSALSVRELYTNYGSPMDSGFYLCEFYMNNMSTWDSVFFEHELYTNTVWTVHKRTHLPSMYLNTTYMNGHCSMYVNSI